MLIIGCSHGKHLASKVAKKLKKPYSELKVKKFPDNELGVRYLTSIKKKVVVLIQSFYGEINDCLIEILFAAYTAKDLGAKKIILVAPFFPYLRQDKRFKAGDCISIEVLGKLIDSIFNCILIIDPHLHREKDLHHIFNIKSKKLTANKKIADYINKKHNIKNSLIIGPDWESYRWAGKVADMLKCDSVILEKKRLSGRKVIVKLNKNIDLNGKNIIIIDDMISTGNTLIEAIKNLKKLGAKKFDIIAVHGIFAENALEKLRKMNVRVVTTNTIPNKASKIDISGLIAENLKDINVK